MCLILCIKDNSVGVMPVTFTFAIVALIYIYTYVCISFICFLNININGIQFPNLQLSLPGFYPENHFNSTIQEARPLVGCGICAVW